MPIPSIAILTCDRPQALLRCLMSYLQNTQAHHREIEFLISDDTADVTTRQATRQMLKEIRSAHGVRIAYAGLEEKQAFSEALKREVSGLDESIGFALFNPLQCSLPIGANRNAVLLATVGDCFLGVDDDTLAHLFTSPQQGQSLALSSAPQLDLTAFPNVQASQAFAHRADQDLIGLHERVLGATVDACLDAYLEKDVDMKEVSPLFAKKLVSERGCIRLSWTGLLGDSGFKNPTYLWRLRGKAREMWVKDEPTYRAICSSRQILRVPKQLTIGGETGSFQSIAMAYDNRVLLPPFPPFGRGEDGVFGALFLSCFTDDFVAYLPWAIQHDPQPLRENNRTDIQKESTGQWHDLLRGLVLQYQTLGLASGTQDAARLVSLGEYLTQTADQEPTAFAITARQAMELISKGIIPSMKGTLHHFNGTPRYWAADLKAFIQNTKKAQESATYGLPEELQTGRTPEEAWALTQTAVRRFGRLLIDWPSIVDAAQRLKSKGIRITRPI